MKLTEIDFYYNVPFDLQNTIHFSSEEERDNFFSQNVYKKFSYNIKQRFNFVRDRLTLKVQLDTEHTNGLNYLRFRNEFDNNKYFYCFVERVEYLNYNVTKLYLVADVVMNYTQGEFTKKIGSAYVKRMSATLDEWNRDKLYLSTNADVLSFPKQYVHKDLEYWKDLYVMFTSSVDLTSDFGTEKDPKLTTSKGQVHDNLTSPVDIYLTKDMKSFNAFTKELSNFPWIAQNLNNVALIPAEAVDKKDLEQVKDAKSDFVNKNLFKFKDDSHTASKEATKLASTKDQLKEKFNLKNYPDFIFRSGYTNLALTNWSGQKVQIDPAQLPEYNLKVIQQMTLGYHTEIDVFPDRYNSDNIENSITGLYRGSYKDNAIIFKDFDSIPILIDNYKLGLAQNAHQRAYANSNTFTGRLKRVVDGGNSLQDRLMSALSLTSSVTSLSGIAGGLTSDYDYYRKQQAEFEDMAINAPSVGEQSTSNGFAIGRYHYGVTAQYEAINQTYAKKVVLYHALFGFDYQGQFVKLNPIESHKVSAYYSFSGSYIFDGVPSQFFPQLKVLLENGIHFWKNNGTENPMKTADATKEFI